MRVGRTEGPGWPIDTLVLGGERARPLSARLGLAVVSLALVAWAAGKPPAAHAARTATVVALPQAFRTIDIAGFRLHTDGSPDLVQMVGESLRVCEREFLAWVAPLGVPVRRTPGPLEVLLFSRHEDFLAFARQEDAIDASWMGGYYAAESNRVVLYDDVDSPEFRALLARCPADASGQALARAVLADARRATARKAMHEVAHLLSFNVGLQDREAEYPLWLTEGIAEAFVHAVMGPEPGAGASASPTRSLLALGCSGGLHRADLHDLYDQSRALVGRLRAHDPSRLAGALEAFRGAARGSDPLQIAEGALGPAERWAGLGGVAGATASDP